MSSKPLASRTTESLERALDFIRSVLIGTADDVRSIPAGFVITTPSLPSVWSANQLRVTEPLEFDELIELAEDELPGLPYVDLAVEHQQSGRRLEPRFRAARWKVQRDLLMVLSVAPDRLADTSVVVDAGEDEVLELMGRWYHEDPGPVAMERAQLVEFSRREARVRGDHLLGVRSSDGQLVAMTKMRPGGRTAQVEDVYTVPEARGRGYARALVSRAVELASEDGAELIFITADDEDWPKLLYARMGFRAFGHVWHFHHQ